jgi:hypothetical protein
MQSCGQQGRVSWVGGAPLFLPTRQFSYNKRVIFSKGEFNCSPLIIENFSKLWSKRLQKPEDNDLVKTHLYMPLLPTPYYRPCTVALAWVGVGHEGWGECNRYLEAAFVEKCWLLTWTHKVTDSRIKAWHPCLHFVFVYFTLSHSLLAVAL